MRPAEIGDREDDALAEAVEGDRDVVAGDEEPGVDHLVLADVLRRQMLLQRGAIGAGIADAEAALQVGAEAAVLRDSRAPPAPSRDCRRSSKNFAASSMTS